MIWANALILGLGGLLITVPVLLHLLMQPKPKELMFPALRFLQKRRHKNRTNLRLRHWLLLLLRCLLIALAALAMAGPSVASAEFGNWMTLGGITFAAVVIGVLLLASLFMAARRSNLLVGFLSVLLLGLLAYGAFAAWRVMNSDNRALIGDSQAPIAAVIVMDTSPTMEYLHENRSRLDQAKEMADWLIGQFPSDSKVCVLATDGDQPFFSVDQGAAKRRVSTLGISYVSSLIPDGIANSLKLLEEAPQERKELYVISDLTTRNWNTTQTTALNALMKRNPEMNLFLIDVGIDDPVNISLGELTLNSELLTPGSGLNLQTSINREGPAGQRTVRLRLEQPDPQLPTIRDGVIVTPGRFWERSTTVDLRANGSEQLNFSFNETLPIGYYHGSVSIEGVDGLAVDNQRYFTVNVTRPWKTLLIPGPGVDAEKMLKFVDPDGDTGSVFDCDVQSQRTMTGEFGQYRLVVLLNPAPLSPATWTALENYVRAGGGLALFAGHNAAEGAVAHPSFVSESATRVLGGALTSQWNRSKQDPVLFSPGSLAHPLFEPFRSMESAIPWDAHPVYKHWGFEFDELSAELPTQVVMSFSNGEPALIERRIGAGSVMLMTTPVTEPRRPEGRKPWSDLFSPLRRDVWPAWLTVHMMSRYLVNSDAETLNVVVGQSATLKNDRDLDPPKYRIYTPETKDSPESVSAVDNQVRYKFTSAPGQYRLKEGLVNRGFSVNINEVDTVLQRMVPEQLDTLLGADRYQVAREQSEIQRQQGTTRRGQEFYTPLVLMMVLILAVEYLMSNRFYQSN